MINIDKEKQKVSSLSDRVHQKQEADTETRAVAMEETENSSRQQWSSTLVFIFASVGAAIGLGNIWRFPHLVYKYGGGSFLIAYFSMLLLVGLPFFCMETAFGQKMQYGPVKAFSLLGSSFKYIGVMCIAGAFLLASYYSVIMAWILRYLFYSFSLGWGENTHEFFFKNVLELSDTALHHGGCVSQTVFALLISWVFIYFCIWKGVKGVGRVVLITMPLPLILLGILFFRGLFLPGAMNGIRHYFHTDFSLLFNSELWFMAASQIFFTLTIGQGTMIAYGSYKGKKTDIVRAAVITTILNSGLSFIAGFVVFSVLGYISLKNNVPIDKIPFEGISLAFITFPKALSLLPYPIFFSILFFVMLFTLAIDSGFSLIESFASFFYDKYPSISKPKVVFCLSVCGFIFGLFFTTRAGLYYLEITDHFLMAHCVLFCGLCQSCVVGWGFGAKKLRLYMNEVSHFTLGLWWEFSIKYVIPILLAVILLLSLYRDIKTHYMGYPQSILLFFGWSVVFLFFMLFMRFLLGYLFSKKRYSAQKIVDVEPEVDRE